LESTNRYVLEEARLGAHEGLVAVADVQSGGRGRLGRSWESPPGASLLVSVLLRPDLPGARLHLVTAAMAVAAGRACFDVAGVHPGIKWPNDLMIANEGEGDQAAGDPLVAGGAGKLGGVLADVELPAVVVGLGLNVDWPRSALPAGAGCLGSVDRDALLEALLAHLDSLYGDWARVAGEYRERCVTVGRAVRVELANEVFTGTATGLSDEGHLLVVRHDGPERVQAVAVAVADVVHLRLAMPD